MNRRLAILVLGLMLAGLQYRFWIGDGGVYDIGSKTLDVVKQEDVNLHLRQRNAALDAEVADLRTGGAAIEAHARKTLGMVKRGETFYLVVQADAAH